MSRGPLNIKARIEKQEKKILQLTKELESAKDEYQKLIEEKEEEDRKDHSESTNKCGFDSHFHLEKANES